MDFLAIIQSAPVSFLIILTVLVFVHEFGHFFIARRNGVRVEVFSIGFGPELFGWNDKANTRWKISAIPLGGYVKMFGDADATSSRAEGAEDMTDGERAVSFHHKRLSQRAAIVAAGPIANFAFAILLLAGLYATVGQRQTPAVINEVSENSAAAEAGLLAGDEIVRLDGTAIERFGDVQRIVSQSPDKTLATIVLRDDKEVQLSVTPRRIETKDAFGNEVVIGRLGVRSGQIRMVRLNPLSAAGHAAKDTWSFTIQTLDAVGQIIAGQRGSEELGGPLRIAQMSGDVAQTGIVTTIWFMAILSINLGLINLFPVPILDGGHLVFYIFEALRGRPVGEKVQEWASIAGLSLVIGLMLLVTWNDLVHLKVFELIGSLFS
ncbi:MAG: RIP metalloprotease RseP [Rhodospirillaceae bacterium]|nr:RIP metalloprotease RseP [Rhodospirillaceae bacterium]